MNSHDRKIYLQGQSDLLKEIEKEMYGQLVGYVLESVLREHKYDKFVEKVKKELEDVENSWKQKN